MIRISRKRFLLIAFSAFILYFVAYKLSFLIGAEFSEGKIIRLGKGRREVTPLVRYYINGKPHTFTAETGFNYWVGKDVTVVYKREPELDAKIFSFFGFWYVGVIYALIPLIVFSAAVLSFLEKGESIVLDYRNYFRRKSELQHPTWELKDKNSDLLD